MIIVYRCVYCRQSHQELEVEKMEYREIKTNCDTDLKTIGRHLY